MIYAYQGLGAAYAMLPNGYGTDGCKEKLVRIAGACWPFGWTCQIIWQARAALAPLCPYAPREVRRMCPRALMRESPPCVSLGHNRRSAAA